MTHSLPNDGLLKAARILTTIFIVLLAIAFVGLAIAVPVAFFSQSHIVEIMQPDATSTVGGVLGGLSLVLVCGMGFMALGVTFLRKLRQIIDSVGDGDPFVAENADRLTRMGWIAVAVELLKFPAGAAAIFVASQVEAGKLDFNIEFSLTGILIALVLFILARVFRHGAEMREDLEGTV